MQLLECTIIEFSEWYPIPLISGVVYINTTIVICLQELFRYVRIGCAEKFKPLGLVMNTPLEQSGRDDPSVAPAQYHGAS